jgi:hypothetical protein
VLPPCADHLQFIGRNERKTTWRKRRPKFARPKRAEWLLRLVDRPDDRHSACRVAVYPRYADAVRRVLEQPHKPAMTLNDIFRPFAAAVCATPPLGRIRRALRNKRVSNKKQTVIVTPPK